MNKTATAPAPFSVGQTLGTAFRVYRLLFRRSITTAACVYAVIALIQVGQHTASGAPRALLVFVGFLAGLAGPLLVQGALVEIVRNVHEGRPPERIGALFSTGSARFWPLLWASILYAIGVGIGLVLLVVPGLILAARWSLLAPLVVLERCGASVATGRSSALVKGQTGTALACIFLMFLIVGSVTWAVFFSHAPLATEIFVSFAWSTLAAPFTAHTLTVIYYRLADPGKPVIDPGVLRWNSVWEGR